MKKVLLVIVICLILGGGGYVGFLVYQGYQAEVAKAEAETKAKQEKELEAKSIRMIESLKENIKTKPAGSDRYSEAQVKDKLDGIIINYPNTTGAQKAKEYKENIDEIMEEINQLADQRAKEAEEKEKRKKEQRIEQINEFWNKVRQAGGYVPENKEYWYDYFDSSERKSIVNNSPKPGQDIKLVLFLRGRYHHEETTTDYGTSHSYYGRSSAKYGLISSDTNGEIDYLSTK